jgi:integrase
MPPKLDVQIIQPLTDDDLRALIKACSGLDPFRDCRDEAIIRVMLETGLRAGELVEMTVSDTNLAAGEAIVRRGKGGKGKIVPLGPHSVRAFDRYIPAFAARIDLPTRMVCGSAIVARRSATSACTARYACLPTWPAWSASTRTGYATPPLIGSSQPAAPKAA